MMKAPLIALCVLTVFMTARAGEKKTFEQDVLDAIERISSAHGIPREEGSRKARALFADSLSWPVKGGVAVIRDQMYVLARSKNGVIAGGETIYGSTWESPELFVFANGSFVGRLSVPHGSENDVVLALFTREKVRFFDWNQLSGGYFPRRSE